MLEYILLAPIGTVSFEVEPLLPRLLRQLREQFRRTASRRMFNPVENREVGGSNDEVGVRVGIGRAQLETRRERIFEVTNEAHKHRAVARWDRGRCAKRCDDADRSLKARLQTVERIVRRRDERVDCLIVLEQPHQCAVADGIHIVRILIIGGKETVPLSVLCDRREAKMRVLAVAREPDQRFRLEVDLKPVEAEDLTDKRAHEQLIVRRLHGTIILPVDLDLLADVRHAAALVNLRLEPADLLVPHLHAEAVFVKLDEAVLERRADRSVRAFPILLIHHLRGGHLLDGCVVVERGLDPKLKLRRRRERDVHDVRTIQRGRTRDLRIGMEKVQQFLLDIGERIHKYRTRVDALLLVNDKGRNTQRPNRQPRLLIRALGIVVHEPVDRRINRKIHLRVVDRCNLRQDDRGTVRLHSSSIVEFLNVLNENPHGNLLVRIVSRHVDADKRDEAHLWMRLKLTNDLFTRRIGRNLIEKFIHLCVPPFSKRMPCGINSRAHLTIFRRTL